MFHVSLFRGLRTAIVGSSTTDLCWSMSGFRAYSLEICGDYRLGMYSGKPCLRICHRDV